jgi:hypothetical protein
MVQLTTGRRRDIMTRTMRFLPVVARELGAIARRPSAYWIRSGAALAAFLAMGWVALLSLHVPLLEQGRTLFQLLSVGAFAYCLVAGIRGTSDALSEEKREGTLGLLFLTDLKGYDVVFGKFVSLSINSFYGVIAIVPALALAFLLGGISGTQFVLMSACLVNTLFFSLAVGILVSTFSQNERAAMSGALGIIFTLTVAPYALAVWHTYGILEIWETQYPGFLIPSPIFAFHTAGDANLAFFLKDDLLFSIAFLHLCGWLCIVISSACIARRAHLESPRGRFLAWFNEFRNRLAYGKAQHRHAIRARSLDRNAFFWLASRDRLKSRYAWAFLGLMTALWILAQWAVKDLLTEWPIVLGCLWFLHLFYKVWISSEIAARFIEDRRSNGLELLLTTPLTNREFVAGQALALLRHFAGPLSFIIFLNIIGGVTARGAYGFGIPLEHVWQFFAIGLIHLVADFFVILWVTIWRSQRLRGTNRTILQTAFFVIVVPVVGLFVLFQAQWMIGLVFNIPEPSNLTTYWRWTILTLAYDLMLIGTARTAFLRDFREIATQNFDRPNKKSAKKIKVTPRPSKNRALRWAIATSIVFILLYSFAAIRRNRLRNEVEQRFAAIRARGMPVSPMDIPQSLPAPPDHQNIAQLLKEAQKVFVPHPDINRLAINRDDPKAIAAGAIHIERNQKVLQVLEDLPNRQGSRQPIDGRRLNPEDLIDLLHLKATLELRDGTAEAGHTITRLLQLAGGLEGNFGTQFASKTAVEMLQELLERGAVNRFFTAENWREWQSILTQFDPIEKLRISFVIERANGLELFKASPEDLMNSFGRRTTSFPSIFAASLAIRRFVGQDQKEILEYLDIMESAIEACNQPLWTISTKGRPNRRPSVLTSSSIIVPQIAPATDWIMRMAIGRLARVRLLKAATIVEIYRAQNSTLPENLAEAGADKIIDPFTGQPFEYIKSSKGYLIRSAGQETRDTSGSRWSAEHRRSDLSFRCEPAVKIP